MLANENERGDEFAKEDLIFSDFWERVYSVLYTFQKSYSPSTAVSAFCTIVLYFQLTVMILAFQSSDQYTEPLALINIYKYVITPMIDPPELLNDYDSIHLIIYIMVIVIYYTVAAIFAMSMYAPFLTAEHKTTSFVCFFLHLSNTILFIPITNLLLSFMDCSHWDAFGCWEGLHFLFVVLGIVTILILFILTYFVSFSFNDSNILSSNAFSGLPFSHMNSLWHAKLYLTMFKSIMDVKAISDSTSDILKYLFYFALCLWIRYIQEYDSYYYSHKARKIVLALATIICVSSGTMVILVIAESVYKIAGSLVWSLAILFTIAHQILSKELEINDWITGTDFWKKIFGLYHLLRVREYQREDIMIFRGFILEYIKKCEDEDIVESLINATSNSAVFNENSLDKHKSIIQKIIETEFNLEANRRKNLIAEDRDAYELFVLARSQYSIEVCKKTQSSMLRIKDLRATTRLAQFNQYKLIRKVEDLEYESERKGKHFLMLKLLKHEESLRNIILKEADLVTRLWTYVSVENPDIDEIESLIRSIIRQQEEAKKIWDIVESCNTPMPSLYRMYISYLEDLHGDYISSARLKSIEQEMDRTGGREDNNAFDIGFNKETGTALVFASGENHDAGVIHQVNSSFSQMFGYLPLNIIGQSIDALLPSVIKTHHKTPFFNATDITIEVINKKIKSFAKHKNGYIFPISLGIKKLVSFGQDTQFVASIEKLNTVKPKAYLLTDLSFNVTSVSEKANYVLGISKRVIKGRSVNLALLCPEIFGEPFEKYKDTKLRNTPYYFPLYTSDEVFYFQIIAPQYAKQKEKVTNVISVPRTETPIRPSITMVKYDVKYSEIKIGKIGVIGYSFRFTSAKPKINLHISSADIAPLIPYKDFQFTYNEQLGVYIRSQEKDHDALKHMHTRVSRSPSRMDSSVHESMENDIKDFTKAVGNQEQCFSSIIGAKIMEIQAKLHTSQRSSFNEYIRTKFKLRNYGENIKTYRILDIEKEVHDLPYVLVGEKQDEVVEEGARSAGNLLTKKQDEEFRVRELLKNREDTKTSIRENFRMSGNLKIFFFVLLSLNISFLLVGVIQHVYMRRTGQVLSKSLNQSTTAYERAFLLIETVHMIALTTYIFEGYITVEGYTQVLTKYLNENYNKTVEKGIANLNDFMMQDTSEFLPEHQKFLKDKLVVLNYFPNETYNLVDGMALFYSVFKKIMTYPIYYRVTLDQYVAIAMWDTSAVTLIAIQEPNFYILELFDHISQYRSILIYFIFVPTIMLIVAAIANVWTLISIINSKRDVVVFVFSVSSNQIEELIKRGQDFSAAIKGNVDTRDLDESLTDIEDRPAQAGTVLSNRLTGKRRMESRQFTRNYGNLIGSIMKYLLVYVLFEVFYIYCYFSNTAWSDRFSTFKTELNETGQATIHFLFAVAGNLYQLMHQSDMMQDYIRFIGYPEIVQKVSVIETAHMMYGKNVGSEFDDIFNQLTKGNLCDYLDLINCTVFTKESCESFVLHGILTEGLFSVFTYLRTMISIDLDRSLYLKEMYSKKNASLYTKLMIDAGNTMDELQFAIAFPSAIQPFVQYLLQVFCNSINNFIDTETAIQFYVLVAFICAVIMFEILCATRVYVQNEMSKELANIITIIPPQYVVNNRVLVDYMKKYTKGGTK